MTFSIGRFHFKRNKIVGLSSFLVSQLKESIGKLITYSLHYSCLCFRVNCDAKTFFIIKINKQYCSVSSLLSNILNTA